MTGDRPPATDMLKQQEKQKQGPKYVKMMVDAARTEQQTQDAAKQPSTKDDASHGVKLRGINSNLAASLHGQ